MEISEISVLMMHDRYDNDNDNDNDKEIGLFHINHLNTMIRGNKVEKNNVVNEQETIQNNTMEYKRNYISAG